MSPSILILKEYCLLLLFCDYIWIIVIHIMLKHVMGKFKKRHSEQTLEPPKIWFDTS